MYPQAAKAESLDVRLLPLFLAVMRDDAQFRIVKALCDLYPEGASTRNRTNSFPLHFACKRNKPNLKVIKLLIGLNPGALTWINAYGLHPLHCLVSSSDNLSAVEILHAACPDAVKVADRQGRTPLHLAVILVGRDHQNAVVREEELQRFEREQEGLMHKGKAAGNASATEMSGATDNTNVESDSDSDHDEFAGQATTVNDNVELGTRSRKVVLFLISVHPEALLIQNNFHATPVETVLEKARKNQSKSKNVLIWGLFDDNVTARVLLSCHRRLSRQGILPGLRPTHLKTLFELNWQCRKYALLASFGGCLPSSRLAETAASAAAKGKGHNRGKSSKPSKTAALSASGPASKNLGNNILARLRLHGHDECIKLCLSWI